MASFSCVGCARDRLERSANMGKTCQVLTNMGITICFAEERFVQNRRLSNTVETWELNLRSENRRIQFSILKLHLVDGLAVKTTRLLITKPKQNVPLISSPTLSLIPKLN